MAVLVDENNIISGRIEYRDVNGNRAFNLLHYRLREVSVPGGGLFPGEDWAAVGPPLAQALADKVQDKWQVWASNEVVMTGASVQDIHPAPRSTQFTYNFPVPVTGDVESEALPLQDAPTILKRSAFGERWGLGRLFMVGVPESHQKTGYLTEAAMLFMSAWCEDLAQEVTHVTNGNTFFWRPVLFSPNSGVGGTARITELVEIVMSNNIIKTQRRRRPGKGI